MLGDLPKPPPYPVVMLTLRGMEESSSGNAFEQWLRDQMAKAEKMKAENAK